MKAVTRFTNRVMSGSLAVLLCVTPDMVAAGAESAGTSQQPPSKQSETSPSQPAASPASAPADPQDLPDSPGTVRQQFQETSQQPVSEQQIPPASVSPVMQQVPARKPVGTAAAEAADVSGTAASKPAGMALAPAKQRQSRSLLIKMGLIVGAGVAVGAVAVLSSASPSKPPGAR